MTIDPKLRLLRTIVRQNSKTFVDYIIETKVSRRIQRIKQPKESEICIFCNSSNQITKEHVIPKWVFENSTEKYFITDVNGTKQTYNKTIVPACAKCNNDWLGHIESYISDLFKKADRTKNIFSDSEIENIIRWLEIIEYKFHILEIRKKFLSVKGGQFIPYLADFPLSVMRKSKDYSPVKIVSEIRLSRKRITVKSKVKNINSLVVFRTKNKNFSFLHNMNEFIFLEIPQYKIALFYFYTKNFESNLDSYTEAMEIIKRNYDS